MFKSYEMLNRPFNLAIFYFARYLLTKYTNSVNTQKGQFIQNSTQISHNQKAALKIWKELNSYPDIFDQLVLTAYIRAAENVDYFRIESDTVRVPLMNSVKRIPDIEDISLLCYLFAKNYSIHFDLRNNLCTVANPNKDIYYINSVTNKCECSLNFPETKKKLCLHEFIYKTALKNKVLLSSQGLLRQIS
jgi:hypothetical protein